MQRTNCLAVTVLIAMGLCCDHANSQETSKQEIEVRIAGPFQSAVQDKRLQNFLREPFAFDWDSETTATDIQEDMSTCVPFLVDHRALGEIGWSADDALNSDFSWQSKKKPVPKSDKKHLLETYLDPFASAKPNVKAKNQLVRWWDAVGESTSFATLTGKQPTTNAAMLFHFLDNSDLTVHNRAGQWMITTQQRAEEQQGVRLYDVTKITSIDSAVLAAKVPSAGFATGDISGSFRDDDSLIGVIETSIDADSWEALGGPSTNRVFTNNDRSWLVVTACVTTHWKIEAFLNEVSR